MAWNFGTNAGCMRFSPIGNFGLTIFLTITVDFLITGPSRLFTMYQSTDTLFNNPTIINVSNAEIEFFAGTFGGGSPGSPHSTFAGPISLNTWHHLLIYTDSAYVAPVCILDGVTLTPTVINVGGGYQNVGDGFWVIGGYTTPGPAFVPAYSGKMAHFSFTNSPGPIGFDGTTAMRDAIRVYRWSPLYFRDYIDGSTGTPRHLVYVPMADEVSEEICRVTGVTLTKVGSVTREDDPQGWWVIGRMDPYTDWAVAVGNGNGGGEPTPLATKIVAEFIL